MNISTHRIFSGEAYCRLCLRFSDEAILFSTNSSVDFIKDFLKINVLETDHMCALCSRRIQNSQQLIADTNMANLLLHSYLDADHTHYSPNTVKIAEWEKNFCQTRRYKISKIYTYNIPCITDDNKAEKDENNVLKSAIKKETDLDFEDDNIVNNDDFNNFVDEDLKLESVPLGFFIDTFTGANIKQKKKRNELNLKVVIQNNEKEFSDKVRLVKLSKQEQLDERSSRARMSSYVRSRHKCTTCIKPFSTQKLLEKHMLKHNDEHGISSCEMCGLRYMSEQYVRRHAQTAHVQRYECTLCGFRSESRPAVDKHCEIHIENDLKSATSLCDSSSKINVESDDSGVLILRLSEQDRLEWLSRRRQEKSYTDAVYRCEGCVKGFIVPEAYEAHLKKHDESYGPALCDVCGQYTKSASSLSAHRLLHYRRYACAQCPYNACIRKPVLEHIAAKHSETPKEMLNFKCPHCDKVFSKSSYLGKHVRRHNEPRSNAQCKVCGKWIHNNDSLRIHTMLKHASAVKDSHKRYACPDCPLRFRSAWQLTGHKSTHSDSRPFYCAPCDIAFKTYTNIRAHQRRKHDDSDKYRFECDYCHKSFPAKSPLAVHIGSIHLKSEVSKCPCCNKGFVNGSRMRSHLRRVHQKAERKKNKICHVCGKSFYTGKILEDHIRTHTGERPYECSLCPAKFTQSGAAHTHNRLVHLKVDRNVKASQANVSMEHNDINATQGKLGELVEMSDYWNV